MLYAVLLIVGLLLLLLAYAWLVEPAAIEVNKHVVEVSPEKLKKPIELLFMSDLHFNAFTQPAILRKIIRQAKAAGEVDAIFLGGDYLDFELKYLPAFQAFLVELTKLKKPLYAVLGNHDYLSTGDDVTPLTDAMTESGVNVLRNQAAVVKIGSQELVVIGLEELETTDAYCLHRNRYPFAEYVERAKTLEWYKHFDDFHPELPRVLLSHNPDGAYLPGEVAPSVVLAGHTHGGQMAFLNWWPKGLLPLFPRGSFAVWSGRRIIGRTTVIVSRGLSGAKVPTRLGRRPEILHITLKPAPIPSHLIIGLSGKPRAGKDTVANMLEVLLPGLKRVAFGNAIKIEYDAMNGTDTLHDEQQKLQHRPGIQGHGNLRRDEDPAYWVKKTINQPPPLLITDVRFPIERDAVHTAKGILIRVEATPETLKARMGEHYESVHHYNEIQLDHIQDWDFVVHNNHGLAELEAQVQEIAEIIKGSI